MYNNLARLALASTVAGFLQVPIDVPQTNLTIPVGPLPWSLPQLPLIDVDFGIPLTGFEAVEHTTDYDDNMQAILDATEDADATQSDLSDQIDDLIGSGSTLPDLSGGGDFAPGITTEGYEGASAYEMAAEMGTNIGTLFSYIRAIIGFIADLDIGPAGGAILFIMLCLLWMLLIVLIRFVIQFVDMVFTLIVRFKELIPFI